ARNLVQTSDVVLVMLHGVERNTEWKIGERGVHTVLLVDLHLVVLEAVVHIALRKLALEQLVRQQIAVAHAGGRNGAKAGEEGVGLGVLACNRSHGGVPELIVVAIVSERSCTLRVVLQAKLEVLLKQRVLGGNAVGYGCGRGLCEGKRRQGGDEERAAENVHMTESVADGRCTLLSS